MPLDTSIPLRAFDADVRLISPQEHQQNALARQMSQLQLQNAQAEMQDKAAARQNQNALSLAYKAAYKPNGELDENALVSGMAQAGLGSQIPGVQKTFAETKKAKIDADSARLKNMQEHVQRRLQLMSTVRDQNSHMQAIARLKAEGEDVSDIPMQYDQAYYQSAMNEGLSIKDQLEQKMAVRRQTEVERNNQTQNRISQGNLGVEQAKLGLSRQRLSMEQQQPKGQYDSSRGILVDPRTGQAMPVTMQGGAPLPAAKKTGLKMIPATVNRGIVENVQSLDKVEKALKLMDGKTVGKMIGDKDATGWKGVFPDAILNRTDPKGTSTRALIADIGSLKIHDRSGAAVTASETPRLKPFIPSVTDDAATVKKKLESFRAEYQQMVDDMADIYSEDQGYVPNPALERRKTRQPPAASDAGGATFLGFE